MRVCAPYAGIMKSFTNSVLFDAEKNIEPGKLHSMNTTKMASRRRRKRKVDIFDLMSVCRDKTFFGTIGFLISLLTIKDCSYFSLSNLL